MQIWRNFVDDNNGFDEIYQFVEILPIVQIWRNVAKPAEKIIQVDRDNLNRRAPKIWRNFAKVADKIIKLSNSPLS